MSTLSRNQCHFQFIESCAIQDGESNGYSVSVSDPYRFGYTTVGHAILSSRSFQTPAPDSPWIGWIYCHYNWQFITRGTVKYRSVVQVSQYITHTRINGFGSILVTRSELDGWHCRIRIDRSAGRLVDTMGPVWKRVRLGRTDFFVPKSLTAMLEGLVTTSNRLKRTVSFPLFSHFEMDPV